MGIPDILNNKKGYMGAISPHVIKLVMKKNLSSPNATPPLLG
jgi:hypothetical protein